MGIWVILKILKKNYLIKKSFVFTWRAKKLLTKSMNMFLMFEINFKWKQWEIVTTCFCHNLYLKCDVLLLADVSEKFRNNSLKIYGLCPSNYLSTPGLNWNAMFKMTKIDLELISDPNMCLFFEKGTRGGISYISNRYNKANNKYLKSYGPKEESKHIIYLDVNNLYSYAMCKVLTTDGFKWMDFKRFDLNKYTSNSSKGCVLEADLEYAKSYKNYTMIIV